MKIQKIVKQKVPVGRKLAVGTPLLKGSSRRIKVKNKQPKTLHSRYV